MALYVRKAGSTGRPLGNAFPVDGFESWFAERRAGIVAARERSTAAGKNHTDLDHMRLVSWDHAFHMPGYTNVHDPETGRQEAMIAKVIGAAGVQAAISSPEIAERTWPKESERLYHVARLEIEYAAAVEILAHYAAADPAAIVAAGEDQDAVIRAALGTI